MFNVGKNNFSSLITEIDNGRKYYFDNFILKLFWKYLNDFSGKGNMLMRVHCN